MGKIVLNSCGSNSVECIKIVRELTGLGLKESKDIIDEVQKGIPFSLEVSPGSEYDIIEQFNSIGASAYVDNNLHYGNIVDDDKKSFSDTREKLTDDIIERMSREELVNNLNSVGNCIRKLERMHVEHDTLISKMQEVKKKKEAIEQGFNSGCCLGIIMCLVGLWVFIAASGDGLGIVILVVGIIISSISQKKGEAGAEERKQQAEEYFKKEYLPLQEKKDDLENNLKNLLNSVEYYNARLLIPDDYFDEHSVSCINRILQNRRAKTLEDAINLYEVELHQQRLEVAANRSADAQERQAYATERQASAAEQQVRYSENIARNTKATARASQLNAFINYMKK